VLLKYDAYTQRNYLAVFIANVPYLHIWHIFQIVWFNSNAPKTLLSNSTSETSAILTGLPTSYVPLPEKKTYW